MNEEGKTIEHVDRLNSIAKLEKEGFTGLDNSLEESLFEYGVAWKDLGEETLFIYRIRGEGENTCFDRCTFNNNTDAKKEFNWVDWDSFFSWSGATPEEWDKFPFYQKIYDLFLYYGCENIFGSSYWEGFKIKG